MAAKTDTTGVDWDSLTPEQKEAYIPRGEFKDPSLLDHGNAPVGAPTTPQPELSEDDPLGKVGSDKKTSK